MSDTSRPADVDSSYKAASPTALLIQALSYARQNDGLLGEAISMLTDLAQV